MNTSWITQETREQRRQDKLSTRLNKVFTGTLKPSDTEIIERLKVQSNAVIQRV